MQYKSFKDADKIINRSNYIIQNPTNKKNKWNEEFNNNVTQFDLLINATTSEKEILTIEKVVLANYEEIIKKNI